MHPPNLEKMNMLNVVKIETDSEDEEPQVFIPHVRVSPAEQALDPDSPARGDNPTSTLVDPGHTSEPEVAAHVAEESFPAPVIQQQPRANPEEHQNTENDNATYGEEPAAQPTVSNIQQDNQDNQAPTSPLPMSGSQAPRSAPSKAQEIRRLINLSPMPPCKLVGKYLAVWTMALTSEQQEWHKRYLQELAEMVKNSEESNEWAAEELRAFLEGAVHLAWGR